MNILSPRNLLEFLLEKFTQTLYMVSQEGFEPPTPGLEGVIIDYLLGPTKIHINLYITRHCKVIKNIVTKIT